MAARKVLVAFIVQWWTVGLVILYLSVRTVMLALPSGHAERLHAILLGGTEAVAALLFLLPATMRLGAVGLLITFTAAFVMHAQQGQYRTDLLLYAAVVSFVAVHGPVRISSLFGRP